MTNNAHGSGFGPETPSSSSPYQKPTASVYSPAPAPCLGPNGEVVVDSYSTTGSVSAYSTYPVPPPTAFSQHQYQQNIPLPVTASTTPHSYNSSNYVYDDSSVYPSSQVPPSTPHSHMYNMDGVQSHKYFSGSAPRRFSAPAYSADGTSMAVIPKEQLYEEAREPLEGTAGASTTTMATSSAPQSMDTAGHHGTYPKEVLKMKVQRKRMTVAAGVTGGLVGLVALGPLGAVVGATGGAVATRAIGKRRERKTREKIAERAIADQQRNAPEVLVHRGSELL